MADILNCHFKTFLQKSQRGNKQIRVQQVQIYKNGYITNFYPKMPPSVQFCENGPCLKAAIKRYMIALSDDTKTKFIGEIVFELYAIW